MSEIESITDILPRAAHLMERLIVQGARKGRPREAAPDMESNEDLFDFEEVTPESSRD